MSRIAIVAAAIALAALFRAEDAQACTCLRTPPVAVEFRQAAAVFAGRVVDVSPLEGDPSEVTVKFAVSRFWKGSIGKVVEVRTGAMVGGDCGISFERGTEWLIYAEGREDGLSVSICSRSSPLGDAAEDLAALGRGSSPQ